MSIESNIAARKAAEAAFELASESILEYVTGDAEAMAKAWRMLGDMVDGVTNTDRDEETVATPVGSMTDEEARRFERQKMAFGVHKDSQVKDVPMDYLLWIDGDEFRDDLRRYLRRPDVQREQEAA